MNGFIGTFYETTQSDIDPKIDSWANRILDNQNYDTQTKILHYGTERGLVHLKVKS